MVPIDRKNAEQALDNLLASKIFSETDKKILRYLVQAHLAGETPKETTIAIDVFGKTADFNPANDSIVRSHIYNLRKKLKEYYLSEGKNNSVYLEIPKGHYQIQFHKNSRYSLSTFFSDTNRIMLLGLVLLFAVLSAFLFLRNRALIHERTTANVSSNPPGIWKEFAWSDIPTLIVFGDYYLYRENLPAEDRQRYIRDPKINSPQDLTAYFQMYPDERSDISETSLTFLSNEVPKTISVILNEFQQFQITPKITIASELTWRDVQEHNIIFIGHYQTLANLKKLF